MTSLPPLNDRVPFMRQPGPQFATRDGMRRPLAFLHPCRVPGCEKEGCYGFGVKLSSATVKMPGLWFCADHRTYLADWERDHPEGTTAEAPKDDLFG